MKLFQEIVSSPPNLTSVSFVNIQCSPKLQDLLKKLLSKNPENRLGNKGGREILQHPWFENIKINEILQKKIKAPFMPKLNGKTDTRNFSGEFTKSSLNSHE